jgi:hypothetical protein
MALILLKIKVCFLIQTLRFETYNLKGVDKVSYPVLDGGFANTKFCCYFILGFSA